MATDGSNFSCEAIKKCCAVIAEDKVKAIKIISVYENPAFAAGEPFAVSPDFIGAVSQAAEKEAEEYTAQAAEIIRKYFSLDKIDLTTETKMGIVAREILDAARDWYADLLVVGSHGRGFWGRTMIGSVSDAVIHNASCPVLLVRDCENKR